MRKIYALFVLLMSLGMLANAQLSPSGQSKLTSPGTLSACGRDSVTLELTNKKGPTCAGASGGASNTTYTIDIPTGNTSIAYEAGSVYSMPAGATATVSGGQLILSVPTPSFGSTTKVKFAINATCDITPSDTLPYFKVAVTYPSGFTPITEAWDGSKMNTGVAQLNVTPAYPLAQVVGFKEDLNSTDYVINNGFGSTDQIRCTFIVSDSINAIGYYGGDYVYISGVNVPGGSVSKLISAMPGATLTNLGNGTRKVSFIIKGNDLDNVNQRLDPGEQISVYTNYAYSPTTCQPDLMKKIWFEPICASGGAPCTKPDTISRIWKISAGTPIATASSTSSDQWDGCPGKNATITMTNTGVPNPARPEVSTAYDMKPTLNMGRGTMIIKNLTINGVVVLAGPVTTNSIDLGALYATDFDGVGVGLDDIDGDGKVDDMKPGAAMVISYVWEVPCDLVCGPNINYDMSVSSTFTDYCKKLNGSSSLPIYKFGFAQTEPISQATPLPDYGIMSGSAVKTVPGSFTFKYAKENVNTAAAVVKLRINYANSYEIVEPIVFLGVTRSLSDFTVIGSGFTPAAGTTAGVLGDATANTTDVDSALEYTLTPAEVALLFDATTDGLSYSMTHISCDSFQNQSNGNNWQLIFKVNGAPTCPAPNASVVPCGMDLACKKGFGYTINEGCGTVPCYIVKDTLYRNAIIGSTDVSKTTTAAPLSGLGTTKFYAGDTLTRITSGKLTGDTPQMENLGSAHGDGNMSYSLHNYFSISYKKPGGTPMPDSAPLEFIPNISRVYVVDTITGDTIANAPLEFMDFEGWGGFTATEKNPVGPWIVGDNLTTGYAPGPGLLEYYCVYKSWTVGGPANADCPYESPRYYNPGSIVYWRAHAQSGATWQDNYILSYEKALARAGYTFAPGYAKYKFIGDTKWRVSETFRHNNIGDFSFHGGIDHVGDYQYTPSGTYRAACGYTYANGTINSKELTVQDPGKQYSSVCGLTVDNKLFFRSSTGDVFPTGEVRVPFTVDSVTVDIPTEYTITSGTKVFNYHQSGTAQSTTAITNSASTGHVIWTSNVGTDFPRFDDMSGLNTVFDIQYALSNIGTDNGNTDSYTVPVKYYCKREDGTSFILNDAYFINEGTGAITITPLGGHVDLEEGGGCEAAYMDVLIANNTLYAASAAILNVEGTATSQIVKIVDIGFPLDPIGFGDTGIVSTNRKYALLGGIAPAEQRLVRVYFNTTVCNDSLKFVTNFGCNYPVGYSVYGYPTGVGNTLDSTYIKFDAIAPKMMVGTKKPIVNVATTCDIVDVEFDLINVKEPNLTNLKAGFKLPANMKYVAGSMKTNSSYYWPYDPSDALVTTGLTSSGAAGDSLVLDLDVQTDYYGYHYSANSCGLPGPSDSLNAYKPHNKIRIKFKVEFSACPATANDVITFDAVGENYCGTKTKGKAVVNINYTGTSTTPNRYTCRPANSLPLTICAQPGEMVHIIDSSSVINIEGPVTPGTDFLEITVGNDTSRFEMSNFTCASPWGNPTVTVSPEGRTILKFSVPAGIATGDSVKLPLQYDIKVKAANLCNNPAGQTCPDISHSMVFYAIIDISCPAKGLTCTSLGQVSRGSGYVPRDFACCAAIGNQVWLDNDKDGIQDPTDVGVAGVTVMLYQNGADGLPGTADDVLVGSTVTDANGNYKFENLQPSNGDAKQQYNVGFTPPANYTFTQSLGAGDNQDNTNSDASTLQGLGFGRTGTYDLVADEYDSTADAGLVLPVPPTASVGNFVWNDTDKDGVQDPGEPGIAGVPVSLKDATGKVIATTITNDKGEYLFENVPPGTGYTVQFGQPIGYVPTQNNGGIADETNSDINPATLTSPAFDVVAGDSIRYVDAGFYPQDPAKASLGNKVWYDTNNDGKQDPGEAGVAGVTVNLYDATGTNIIATTQTDALGNYVFNDLAPGTYSVGFDPTTLPAGTNFVSQNVGTNDELDSDADATTGKSAPVTLAAGDRNMSIDAGIYNPANTNSIGNYVWYDANKDGIQDPTEAAVPGVTVKLYNAAGNVVATTTTDAEGKYLFPGLANGDYSVGFSNLPSGYGFTSQEGTAGAPAAFSSNGSDANPQGRTPSVTLSGNTHNLSLDAGIYPQGAPTETASLGNKVWYDLNNDGIQDAGETGVEGVTVTLLDAGPDGILGNGDDGPSKTTQTNSLGEYIFTNLPAGNYAVEFSNLPAGYSTSPQNVGDDAKDSDGGAIAGGKSTTGVVNLKSGEENLTIDLGINKPNVNSIGNYVWFDVNQDGQQGSATTEPPVPGVMATLLNADGTTYDSDPATPGVQPAVTTTDANGFYLFTDLPDGSYKVKFSNLPAGYQYTTQEASNTATGSDANPISGITGPVSVAGGQTNLTLDAGIYSTKKAMLGNYVWNDANGDGVQDPTEKPISGVLVTLYDGAGNPVATTVTDANGKYLFPNLEPGAYSVGFTNLPAGTEFTTQETTPGANGSDVNPTTGRTAPVTLAAGEVNLDVDAGVRTKPTGGLGNYVWNDLDRDGIQDANEPGVPGVTVTLTDVTTGKVVGTAVTDANGYYLFTDLPIGTDRYTATFSTLPTGAKFTQSNGPVTDATNSDANITTGTTGTASVAAGQINPNVDAGIQLIASLGDYVWNDIDKDGVQDANEVGVAGVTVTLYDDAGNPVSSTVTDAYGKYLFDNLTPGDYTVGFTLPQNYVFTSSTGTSEPDATNSDANPITGKTTKVTLSAGENQRNVDAGIYYAQPTTASVGNYVWFDTNKDGIQDGNEVGLSGVTVTLYDAGGNPVGTTVTDADGFYQFTDVTPGTYSVGFTSPVGMVLSPNNGGAFDPSNSDANPATGKTTPFVVNAGDKITTIDAGFTPQDSLKGSLGDKVWYDLNQNGLQDAGEPGVAGVTVNLYDPTGLTLIATTTTDAFGNYIFNNLNAGGYVVGFDPASLPPGFVITTKGASDTTKNSDANTATGKTNVITLGQGQNNMTIDAGIYNTNPANTNSIGDKVWNDLNKDGIQDPNEPGVPGVTVTLYDAAGNPVATTTTDANGNYLFPNLPNGDYTVGFSNLPAGTSFTPQGQGTSATDSDADPSTGRTAPISLTGNTNVTNVDAGLVDGSNRTGTASLGDKVWYDLDGDGIQDPNESGVQGVKVNLYGPDGLTVLATTTTNALGEYIFTGLNAGSYIVGFDPTTLPAGFTITTPNSDGQGVNGENNSDANATTGKTNLIPLGAGEDKLSVDMGIVPPAGSASLGNLVWNDLNKDGIQDANEPGVPGVSVTLYDATGNPVANTTTDANGNYQFVGLTPGVYSVGFDNLPTGFVFSPKNSDAAGIDGAVNSDVDPATGKTTTVTLAAGQNNPNIDAGINSPTTASLGDYVWNDLNGDGIQDANEPGIGGVLVTIYDASGNPIASTVTGPDGSYLFPNLAPGDYTLGFENLPAGMVFTTQETNPNSATGSNVNPGTGRTPTITLAAGTHNPTVDAGLKTPPLAGLGNYVWYDADKNGTQDAGEQALAGVLVTLYAADGTTVLATAVTDGNGAYSFTNLQPGTYVVGFSNVPSIYTAAGNVKVAFPTTADATADGADSDMGLNGKTGTYTLVAGDYNPTVDAGFFFDFPTPVVMKDFAVSTKECDVNVFWTTATEQNVARFDVMRKVIGASKFEVIGSVIARGNSTTNQSYTYTDRTATNALYEYTLNVVDLDAKQNTINGKAVNVTCGQANDIIVYPNPIQDELHVVMPATVLTADVTLMDAAGKTMYQSSFDFATQSRKVNVSTSTLASGVYFININADGQVYTYKVTK
jgi:protocatechuate 3,4-dioxygenase beta subunit